MDKQDEKQAFAERLNKAIEAAGYEARPSVVEKHFNQRYWGSPVSFQGVRRWLKGESIPEQDKLVTLAEWLGIEPHQLRYGVDAPERAEKPWHAGLSTDEYDIITTFLGLPADKKKVVREVVMSFSVQSKDS